MVISCRQSFKENCQHLIPRYAIKFLNGIISPITSYLSPLTSQKLCPVFDNQDMYFFFHRDKKLNARNFKVVKTSF